MRHWRAPALLWPDSRTERLHEIGRDWVFLGTSPDSQAQSMKALLGSPGAGSPGPTTHLLLPIPPHTMSATRSSADGGCTW